LPYWVTGVLVLGLLVAVNLKGTEETGLFQIVVTALKVALIILFLFGGLQAFRGDVIAESFVNNVDNLRQIGLTSALVFITFFGFEAIATNAEEIENPGRNVPRAIFISMGFVTLIYTLVVIVVVLAKEDPAFAQFLASVAGDVASPDQAEAFIRNNGEIAMGRAAQYYLGDVGFFVIIVGALFSMLSAANATILAGSRVKLAMARRNHLPGQFEDLHSTFETPHRAVLLTGGYILLFILLFTVLFGGGPNSEAVLHLPVDIPAVGSAFHLGIEAIAHFADFMLLFGLVVVNLALIQSRRTDPEIDRPFRVPGVPLVPVLAVLANLVLLVNVEPSSFVLGLLAETIGVILWFGLIGKGPTEEHLEAETPTVLEERHPAERDYRIVVPIANPARVPQLMQTANDIAADRDGEVVVMSVVTLPDQTPLSEGRRYADQRREVIDEAMSFAEEANIPVSGTIRIGHHAADAILNTIRQREADLVLLGWSGTGSRRRDIVLGSTVDAVVNEARCDVLVERFQSDASGTADSILVPTAGGPHAELAEETALAIARSEGSTVRVMHVLGPDPSDRERARAERMLEEAAARFEDVTVETIIEEDADTIGTIVRATEDHDLTIIGATREGLLQEFVFGVLPVAVGQRAQSTVIMTKRHLGITSHFRRWFLRQ
ncbi:MAG: amino acid permease, partial [Halobacteriales archaeon]|nr:amino acid permease [Halobacteriales archaeon]